MWSAARPREPSERASTVYLTDGATTTTLPSGLIISLEGDAGPVSGSAPGLHAAPYLSDGNGLGFGPGGAQVTGVDETTYIFVDRAGSVTLRFPTLQTYLGILWGSVDGYNSLIVTAQVCDH